MKDTCSTSIDCCDCSHVTCRGEYGGPKHVGICGSWELVFFGLFLIKAEDDIENQCKESSGWCHSPSKDDSLRVVTSGISDSSMREWWLLIKFDRHVCCIGRGKQNNSEIEVYYIVYFNFPKRDRRCFS